MTTLLVIGYGNTLRRDDGVGPWVATQVAERLGDAVRCTAVPQLFPELAECIAHARCVVFVDAGPAAATMAVQALGVSESDVPPGTHVSDPRALLGLATALFGSRPQAWLLTVPGSDYSHGEGLSPQTRDGAAQAVAWILAHYRRQC